MKKINTKTEIYEFDDLKIVVIKEFETETSAVFAELDSNLEFVFGAPQGDICGDDIVALYDDGYFDDYRSDGNDVNSYFIEPLDMSERSDSNE